MKRLLPIFILFFLSCNLFEDDSPSSQKLIYVYEYNNPDRSRGRELHIIDIHGNSKKMLEDENNFLSAVDISADGNTVYYRMNTGKLMEVDINGNNKKEIEIDDKYNVMRDGFFHYSNRVLIAGQLEAGGDSTDIGIYDLESHKITNLTKGRGRGYNAQPYISPDDSKIVFISIEWGINNFGLYTVDSTGENFMHIATELGPAYMPQFSPDGSKILFEVLSTDEKGGIYIINSDGTGLLPLVTHDTCSYLLNWSVRNSFSADGKTVVYRAGCNESGTTIGTIDVDGSNKWIFNNKDDKWFNVNQYPVISPDGKYVVFVGLYEDGFDLIRLRVYGDDIKNLTKNDNPNDSHWWPWFVPN